MVGMHIAKRRKQHKSARFELEPIEMKTCGRRSTWRQTVEKQLKGLGKTWREQNVWP